MPTNSTRTPVATRSRSLAACQRSIYRSESDDRNRIGRGGDDMNWLFKEEPSNYNFDALVKDKKTVWSGVKNPVAQRNLRSVKKGDRIFYYHTADEKQIVGIAKALGDAYPDPADATGRAHVVDVGPVKKLGRPVTLKEIKADPFFKD